jgi:hypothetical protein
MILREGESSFWTKINVTDWKSEIIGNFLREFKIIKYVGYFEKQ